MSGTDWLVIVALSLFAVAALVASLLPEEPDRDDQPYGEVVEFPPRGER